MEVLCGIFFESKFDIEVEIIESYIHFNTSQPDIGDQYPPKLAHQIADSSRPKEICRFSFVWGFLFQNDSLATPENKYCTV